MLRALVIAVALSTAGPASPAPPPEVPGVLRPGRPALPSTAAPGALRLDLDRRSPLSVAALAAAEGLRLEPPALTPPPPAQVQGAAGPSLLSLERQEGAAAAREPDAARVARLRRWERALKWSTAGALVATTTLGTFAAINQPTDFGDGRCRTGGPVLGTYGCDRGLSTLHGASAVLSATLYTADGVLALSLPGPQGNVSRAARPWHRALTFVHLGGVVIQPVLGLVSAFPQVVGVRGRAPSDPFPRHLRTAHVVLGYLTTAAFLATLALEL